MIESYFICPKVVQRMKAGPMAPYLGALARELEAEHYSRKSIRRQLRNADSFGWWLLKEEIPVSGITDDVVSRYVATMHRSPCRGRTHGWRAHNARGLTRFVESLRRQGVVPPPVPKPKCEPLGTSDPRLLNYGRYLERVRGVTLSTRKGYLSTARGFLNHVWGDGEPEWSHLRPEHVASYVQQRADRLAVTCRKDPVTPMRAFLRYLTGEGLIQGGLERAIPPVRQWRHAALPRFLYPDDLAKVLATPYDSSVKGLRNRAMLLLLARLGLRASEVRRLCLEDIDWREGNLLIRAGKNHRERILPLPEDVGKALIRYLRQGRPRSSERAVFLALYPPYRPLTTVISISKMAREALQAAGVWSPHPGAHVFRHTIATHLVCRGVTFKAVADLLGHQNLMATGVYAKLDLPSLAQVALPWPGGAQ